MIPTVNKIVIPTVNKIVNATVNNIDDKILHAKPDEQRTNKVDKFSI